MYFPNVTACIILFIDGIVFKWKIKTIRNYWKCLPSDFYWLETALLSSIIIIANISINKHRFKWCSGCLTFSLVCTDDQKLYYTAEENHLSLNVEKNNWGTFNYRQSTHNVKMCNSFIKNENSSKLCMCLLNMKIHMSLYQLKGVISPVWKSSSILNEITISFSRRWRMWKRKT